MEDGSHLLHSAWRMMKFLLSLNLGVFFTFSGWGKCCCAVESDLVRTHHRSKSIDNLVSIRASSSWHLYTPSATPTPSSHTTNLPQEPLANQDTLPPSYRHTDYKPTDNLKNRSYSGQCNFPFGLLLDWYRSHWCDWVIRNGESNFPTDNHKEKGFPIPQGWVGASYPDYRVYMGTSASFGPGASCIDFGLFY